MPHTFHLASLASHIAVEVGDIIHPPGSALPAGKIVEISPDNKIVGLSLPVEAPEGIMRTAAEALGLVWMHEAFVKPRPEGVVDHGPASGC